MKSIKKALALILAFAVVLILCACGSTEHFEWPTSGMAELLPEPSTNEGHIFESSTIFEVTLENTTEEYFQEYLNACKEMGYTLDETDFYSDTSYMAYNHSGYKLFTYFSSNNEISVQLVAPTYYDAGSTFIWPTVGPATLIPEPTSHVGGIETDTSTAFEVYVGETTIDEYNNYVNQCIEAGFDQNYDKSDDSYNARNTEGYRLEVEYKSGNIIFISIKDASSSAREDDTATEDTTTAEDSVIPEVSEEVTVSPALETSSEETSSANTVNEPNAGDDSLTEASEPDILTADNCPEFAEVLSCGDFSNQLYADFYEKYPGKTVEFDGCIVLVEDDKYNGYYDVMICPGNYNDSAFGPQFMFDGAAPSAFEEGNTGLDLPSYVKVGANVHVVATLSRYDDTAGLCYLNPKSVTER